MAFQFQCPRGHLLEADESQVGQQCQCPMCGELFGIPAPAGAGAVFASPNFGPAPPGYSPPPSFMPGPPGGSSELPPAAEGNFLAGLSTRSEPTRPRLVHIPCPQGHELEVPPEMLGQDVLCPHCQTQFRLQETDSIEYKQRKQKALDLKEYKSGQLWMTWAVVVAVVVALGLLILVGISASK